LPTLRTLKPGKVMPQRNIKYILWRRDRSEFDVLL